MNWAQCKVKIITNCESTAANMKLEMSGIDPLEDEGDPWPFLKHLWPFLAHEHEKSYFIG